MYDALLNYNYYNSIFSFALLQIDKKKTESDTDNSKTGILIIQYSSLKTLIHVIWSQA